MTHPGLPATPYYLTRHNAALQRPRPPNHNGTPNVEALVVAMLRVAGVTVYGPQDTGADVLAAVNLYKRMWRDPDYELYPALNVLRDAHFRQKGITPADVATAWVTGINNFDLGRLDGGSCDAVFRRHLPAGEQ